MLSKLRKFKDSKYAMVLVIIIAIPFVMWGMGGAFQTGNTNSIGKINNKNISTKEFLEYIEYSNLNEKYIRENIDKGVLEELLGQLVSDKIINLEIKRLGIKISEKTLANKIRTNKLFFDENNVFSRINYEKFLLQNNLIAPQYEINLKNNELKKTLFDYIGKGINSPYFLANEKYKNQTKKIKIKFLKLDYAYKRQFSNEQINKFILDNKTDLERNEIDISYIKLSPENLSETKEFDKHFFEKIDDIENMILNGSDITKIKDKYNLKINKVNNYFIKKNEKNKILKEIYLTKENDKIQIVEKNNFFLLYEISNSKKILPKLTDKEFLILVKNEMIKFEKNKLHKELFNKINKKEINDKIFNTLTKNTDQIKILELSDINDISIFDVNSLKLIYALPNKSFALIADSEKNIYLAKILDIKFNILKKKSDDMKKYIIQENTEITKNLYSSYDLYINSKYKFKINEKTLDRVKNYFK
tara:strand:- start:165 stop:1589 length:1425 start_codon:yes stop_codon:yes gene_type:complete